MNMSEGWQTGTGRNKAKNQDLHLAARDTNAPRQDKRQWNPGCRAIQARAWLRLGGILDNRDGCAQVLILTVSNSICMQHEGF